jgi:hypothetical protein
MHTSRGLLSAVGLIAVAALTGIASFVMADDQPSNPGQPGVADHGPPPAAQEIMQSSVQTLASLAYINDPTIDCGGPCLAGSREDVVRLP